MSIACLSPETVQESSARPLESGVRWRVRDPKPDHRWSIVLVGGEGRTFGGQSLLEHTRFRLEPIVAPRRTLYVLTEAREAPHAADLMDVPLHQLLVQPCDRGTLAAATYSLRRLTNLDPAAVVAFVPADQHYENAWGFRSDLDLAYEVANTRGDAVVVLGVEADSPEARHDWIEPSNVIAINRGRARLFRVQNIWGSPSPNDAQVLWERGCLWNTSTVVGRARLFLQLIRCAFPDLCRLFAETRIEDRRSVQALYDALPSLDFSRDVLAKSPQSLSVLAMGDVGWTDLAS